MKILVLGVGNILLGDEGVGVRVVERLREVYDFPENIEVLDGGTAGMELLDAITEADHLILVDTICAEEKPGTVVRLSGDEVPAFFNAKLSPHQVGLPDVLAAARLTGQSPSDITLIGIEPETMAMSLELSQPVAAQVAPVAEMVARELRELGFAPISLQGAEGLG